MKKILIVVAHPDDEIIGVGGMIHSEYKKGNSIDLLILSGNVTARKNRPKISELNQNIKKAANIIGINNIYIGKFQNIEFNLVSHLKMVKFIENHFVKTAPDLVVTHHPSDLNNDHYFTSLATQVAIRLSQRKSNIKPISTLLFMEVLSSTEWNINPSINNFSPNFFYQISHDDLDKKIEALSCYVGVMRPNPHPRSVEVLKALATLRGSQAGFELSESFQLGFKRE